MTRVATPCRVCAVPAGAARAPRPNPHRAYAPDPNFAPKPYFAPDPNTEVMPWASFPG